MLHRIAPAQHNVILIIADDLGLDYCGFYENYQDTVAMPNIRRLLAKGVRFRNAWANPLCSPTRAGMLTGRYSFRTGVGTAIGGAGSAVLDTSEMTIPRLLELYAPNQIAKANIGKWHLHTSAPPINYTFPNVMGYDHFEGNFTGTLNSYTNWTKITNGVAANETNYATTETVDNAIDWINAQSKPYFLWLAFNAPHTPYHLPPAGLYSNTSLTGTAAHISANPKEYFKASVEALDHEIGRLFDSLSVLQQLDSTDIIFIGDNGEDAQVAQSTGPAKGTVYQQGVCVPFIISGPSVVNPGRVSDALVNTHDLFATILALFGDTVWSAQLPAGKPVDSKSIMPIVKNQATDIRDWVFTEVFKTPTVTGDGKAMRNDTYKLLDFYGAPQKFYNLLLDPSETNNLLTGIMNTTDISNYHYLCNEMTNLIGSGSFCGTVGVEDIYGAQSVFGVYPNPFHSTIYLHPSFVAEVVELKDGIGRVIYAGDALSSQDFSSLSEGIYFLQIKGRVMKLYKER